MYFNLLEKGFLKEDDLEPCVDGFEFYFDAFYELCTTRQMGMALGPIPFTAIIDYFKLYDLSDFDEFSYVMRRMDRVYLQNHNEVSKSAKGGEKSSGVRDKNNTNKS